VAIQPLILLLIECFVPLPSLPVLIGLFNHGHEEHEEKRCQVRDQEPYSQGLEELRYANQKEEHIEEVLELVEEYDG
jgi:hypothetical protein